MLYTGALKYFCKNTVFSILRLCLSFHYVEMRMTVLGLVDRKIRTNRLMEISCHLLAFCAQGVGLPCHFQFLSSTVTNKSVDDG